MTGAIGFNLADLFDFSSISAGSQLASQSGLAGSFWTGALAAFVATPCTGPFMAAALGAAMVLPPAAAMLIFVGLGLGLSLPFLAIGFLPSVRRRLPKPGPWMSAMRHILAVPMFVTTLGLLWVIGNQTGTGGIILSLAALMIFSIGLWMTGMRQKAMLSRVWVPAAGALLLAASVALAMPHADPSGTATAEKSSRAGSGVEAFSSTKLAALRAQNKPVFLYFTADWCLSCKVNEKIAIDRAPTQAAFARAGVVTMVGDWTTGDAEITGFLQQFGRSGVPLYLWYVPGANAKVLPQILSVSLLSDLAAQSAHSPDK